LPGKPLLDINGKPMIEHVYLRARASNASDVVVATDDDRIARVADAFGAAVCMTSAHHKSGSDRIAEVVEELAWGDDDIVVNLQGDEPAMPPSLIDQVATDLAAHPDAGMSTLSTPIDQHQHLFDPHVVKVVTDRDGYALYFSRAPIPWHRDEFDLPDPPWPLVTGFARHIGLYAYRAGFLRRYVGWQPAPLERAEALEQLRVLWHGGRIHVVKAAAMPGHGVDTPGDLTRVRREIGG